MGGVEGYTTLGMAEGDLTIRIFLPLLLDA